MSRILDTSRFRIVVTGEASTTKLTAHVESIVMDGDMMETPQRTELKDVDEDKSLKTIFAEAIAKTKESEEL